MISTPVVKILDELDETVRSEQHPIARARFRQSIRIQDESGIAREGHRVRLVVLSLADTEHHPMLRQRPGMHPTREQDGWIVTAIGVGQVRAAGFPERVAHPYEEIGLRRGGEYV